MSMRSATSGNGVAGGTIPCFTVQDTHNITSLLSELFELSDFRAGQDLSQLDNAGMLSLLDAYVTSLSDGLNVNSV